MELEDEHSDVMLCFQISGQGELGSRKWAVPGGHAKIRKLWLSMIDGLEQGPGWHGSPSPTCTACMPLHTLPTLRRADSIVPRWWQHTEAYLGRFG